MSKPVSIATNRLRSLALESLESRVNLSSLTGLLTPSADHRTSTQIRSLASTKKIAVKSVSSGATATSIASSGTTSVGLSTYSSISNSQIETRSSGQDIGYVSTSGAYIEYTINVVTSGTYTLNLGLANTSTAALAVSVNGTTAANLSFTSTGSWDKYLTRSTTLSLTAGTNVIRLSSLNGTQYNLNNVSLAVANTTAVGNDTTVAVGSYSAIYNSQQENVYGSPDIGYVSTSGAYIEYAVNVATAGTYNLTLTTAAASSASVSANVNGTTAATYSLAATNSWSKTATNAQSITLTAGTNIIRLSALNGTQYNLFGLEFTLTSPATTTSGPTTIIAPPSETPITAPTNTSANSTPVIITTNTYGTDTELDIVGTSGNDNISVTESNSTITVVANGQTTTYSGGYGTIGIWGTSGDDTINVASSVNLPTRVYAGTGNDTIADLTSGQATIVTIDGGNDNITGNGINTAYWVDSSDTVNASAVEKANGDIHVVSSFYQPFTTDSTSSQYISTSLNGQSIASPAGSTGSITNVSTTSSLFGTGAVVGDVNQGQTSDCYFLAPLESLAQLTPSKLQQMAVDLGDGTYAVAFTKNGVTSYVRVDGNMPSYSNGGELYNNHLGSTGNAWASVMEKAYAYYRYGANDYASLNFGSPTTTYNQLGIAATTGNLPTSQVSFYNTVSAKLAANKGVIIGTDTYTSNAPIIGAHAYSVYAITEDSSGTVYVTLRNPWGFDGAGNDGNAADALVTVTYAQLFANSAYDTIVT